MKRIKLWVWGLIVIAAGLLGNVLLNLFAQEIDRALGMTGLQALSLVCDLIVTGGLAMVGLHLRVRHPVICVLILGFSVLIGGNALINLIYFGLKAGGVFG